MQHNFFRAGLIGFTILTLFLVLTSSAPIPPNQISSATSLSQRPPPNALAQRSPFDIAHGGNRVPHSTVPNVSIADGVATREVATLYRRKGIGAKIKAGVQHIDHKIDNGVKTAAKRVVHFVKNTGAKIAKVGLKVLATAEKGLSKVAQVMPVIGKPISKALDIGGALANKGSNAIHAKIGGKLNGAMNRMNKAQKVMGYIPRELAE